MPPAPTGPRLLYFSLIALILSVLPVLCVAGIICGLRALSQAQRANAAAPKNIAIVAVFIGCIVTFETIFLAIIVARLWF